MNLKNVGSVALSLVAVACIALGVGYNASTLGSDGAKVDAAQESPSINATAPPETLAASVKEVAQEEAATVEEAAQDTPSINATPVLETPTKPEEPKQRLKQYFIWLRYAIYVVGTAFVAVFLRTLGESAAKQFCEFIKNMRNGFVKRRKNDCKSLPTFDARRLSDAASELIVYAMLANKKAIYVDDGKIFLDLTERKKHPFYFDFPLKGNKTVDDVLQELTGCGLLTALNQEEYELTKLVEEHREKLIQRDDNRILKQANETLVLLLQKIRDENSIVVCEHNVEEGRWLLSVKQPGETEGFYSTNREWQEINRIVPILQKNGLVDAWYVQTKNKSRGMKITFEFVGDGCVFDLPPFPGAYTGVEGTITRRCLVLALRATYSNYDELRGNDN